MERTIDFRLFEFLNAPFPTAVTVSGNTTLSNAEHPSNANLPIVFTPDSNVIDLRATQFLKASSPIVLIFECIFTVFKELQPSKRLFERLVTL